MVSPGLLTANCPCHLNRSTFTPSKSHLTAEAPSGTSFEWGAVPVCSEQGENPALASCFEERGAGAAPHCPTDVGAGLVPASCLTNGGEAPELSSPKRWLAAQWYLKLHRSVMPQPWGPQSNSWCCSGGLSPRHNPSWAGLALLSPSAQAGLCTFSLSMLPAQQPQEEDAGHGGIAQGEVGLQTAPASAAWARDVFEVFGR